MKVIRVFEKYKNLFFVGLLLLAGIGIHFYLADFTKFNETYSDELRYYTIARSIWQGKGISIRGIGAAFPQYAYQKIAYSLILAPFFAIRDSLLRVKIMSLMNCVVMMSSIVPVWFIGKELKLQCKYRYLLIALLIIWPETMISMTFMSEILYWPVSLWFIYLWIKNKNNRTKWGAAAAGVVCYAGYLTKEIFLAFFLAYILYECIDFAEQSILLKRNVLREPCYRERLFDTLLFAVTFISIHVLLKCTIFKGLGNSYNQMGIAAILDPYNFLYMIYAFVYYLAAVIFAVCIIPALYPVIYLKYASGICKKLFAFIGLFLVTASATIAYTISVREDLGKMVPRVHLRYCAPVFIILFAVFLSVYTCLDNEIQHKMKKRAAMIFGIGAAFVFLVFKGAGKGSAVDQYSLAWYTDPILVLEQLMYFGHIKSNELLIDAVCVLFNVILISAAVICHFLFRKNKRKGMTFFLSAIFACCIVNDICAYTFVKYEYAADTEAVEDVIRMDKYLEDVMTKDSIAVYFTDADSINDTSKYMDMYMDHISNLYFVDDTFLKNIGAGNELLVRDTEFRENLWDGIYDATDHVDYLILEKDLEQENWQLSGVEKIDAISGNYYTVYKNIRTDTISIDEHTK